jgi:hypothetical protein
VTDKKITAKFEKAGEDENTPESPIAGLDATYIGTDGIIK